jgi:hypothetical protein
MNWTILSGHESTSLQYILMDRLYVYLRKSPVGSKKALYNPKDKMHTAKNVTKNTVFWKTRIGDITNVGEWDCTPTRNTLINGSEVAINKTSLKKNCNCIKRNTYIAQQFNQSFNQIRKHINTKNHD